ncbi:zinc ABC transporter substrate-binding protein [Prauserella sp. PE36]|uniref:Zinc ABC transporter substrate-binding protein n=1 Tax=Prauserella endophytica TaxID=1592324 RepID=A0ABY2SA36_9PSEU|nr:MULTISPECIES: zinc ABC transporter substrate-binding protein AztC [Prauserella]PXY29131.1 ABC transporter substrate-binding protein [Prauserella coralliicola]RBM14094.1 zinc ABC transporter substrate-binding protein [Prauserella sp. PE36]TKG72819.1 zinc ABC transporter substrate-binding protein [Prauserella endophytica]
MRARLCAAAVTLLLALSGCSAAGDDGGGVVVTTNILGDLTRAVTGDEVPVTVLMRPNADPHSFAISAQEAARLEQADLIIHNGLGLEEGVQRNVDAAVDAGVPALAVGEEVEPIRYRGDEQDGKADPHFWTDPRRVRTAVEVITDRLVREVDGIDEATVRANAAAYLERVDEIDRWMTERFAAIPPERRKLVTNHHVFGYLAQRYDFEIVGAVVPSGTTLASPSASDLSELASTIRSAGVGAIFADSSQPDRLARVLADQAGVHVRVLPLFSESLSEPGGGAPTYLDMMRANTNTIVDGLGRN